MSSNHSESNLPAYDPPLLSTPLAPLERVPSYATVRSQFAEPGYTYGNRGRENIENQGVDSFLEQVDAAQQELNQIMNNLSQISALHSTILAFPDDEAVYDPRSRPTLQQLSDLTTRTATLLEPLPEELHSLFKKIPYLQGGFGRLVTRDDSDAAKDALYRAMRTLRGCMERIKIGEWQEQQSREKTRLRQARRIRTGNPDISDKDVMRMLIQSETERKAPVGSLDVSTYKGRWAVENPFTELYAIHRDDDLDFLNKAPIGYVKAMQAAAGGYGAPGAATTAPIDGGEPEAATGSYGADLAEKKEIKSRKGVVLASLVIFFLVFVGAGVAAYFYATAHNGPTASGGSGGGQTTTLIDDVPGHSTSSRAL
ncbi:hypothetical protein MNV49_001996 [Pseudohyphozyma bogoriensis]|nr:hypothetical protein MNV49_001996 [Pseudohyphozyma bogoriensis]